MEIFSIVASVPISLLASMFVCAFLANSVVRSQRASRAIRIGSYVVLVISAIEFALLLKLGAVRTRGIIGPAFTVFHLLVFLMGTPALAGALILRPRGGVLVPWQTAALICTFFALFLVFLQYGVSEALYGVDDVSGPYSMMIFPPVLQPITGTHYFRKSSTSAQPSPFRPDI